jgi:hypothetical protein
MLSESLCKELASVLCQYICLGFPSLLCNRFVELCGQNHMPIYMFHVLYGHMYNAGC